MRILTDFSIRGAIRRESFSTRKPLKTSGVEMPVYFVNPLYKMPSREWISRLHATVNAAIGRGIQKMRINWRDPYKISRESLLILMVFGPTSTAGKISGKESVLFQRNLLKAIGAKDFGVKFEPHRELYEHGIVRGKSKPTFIESYLSGRTRGLSEYKYYNRKLFEVRLSLDEHRQIIKKISQKLQKIGTSIQELHNDWINSKSVEARNAFWRKTFQASGMKEWHQTLETTPTHPVNYLYFLEANRILTNKFVRRGMEWIEKNLPKK